jgi:hypothetical protein
VRTDSDAVIEVFYERWFPERMRDEVERRSRRDGVSPWEYIDNAVRVKLGREFHRERRGVEAPSDEAAMGALNKAMGWT